MLPRQRLILAKFTFFAICFDYATRKISVFLFCFAVIVRGGHDKHFVVEPSRFQWHKFKDLVHYYVLVGAIPCLAVVFYSNVFIGPATLTEPPPGYQPKHWEYHRHPITRWLSRYWYSPPQQEYEKMCHAIAQEHDKARIRLLERDIKEKMAEKSDYEAYYYRPVTAKYHRYQKSVTEKQESDLMGD